MATTITKPFFSIIIPTLNEEKHLPNLLKDLTNQSFQDFEIIIVDGNSQDKTILRAKSFSRHLPHLRIVKSKQRHVCVQRNLGATKAKADTFAFMDADNRLPPYFLQGIKYRLESTNADILTTWFKPDVPKPSYLTIATAMNLSFELQNSFSYSFMLESMIIITKEAFHKIGGFDEHTNYAEGRPLIKRAQQLDLTPITVKDPTYFYSFRRFRKFGTIKVLNQVSQLALTSLFGKEFRNEISHYLYPMKGGLQYSHLPTTKKSMLIFKQFVNKIEKLLQETD